MWKILLLSGLILAAARTPASADPLGALRDLQTYLSTAAENNPELKAGYHAWRAQTERIKQVGALPDPRFSFGWFAQPVETRTGPQRFRYGLFQTVPWFGSLDLKEQKAALEAEAAYSRLETLRTQVFAEIKDAYFEYAYLGQAILIAEENVALLDYVGGVVDARYQSGASPFSDLIKVQLETDTLRDRVRTLRELRGPLAGRLNAAMNKPLDAPLSLPQTMPQVFITVPDEELIAQVAETNPELAGLDRMAEASATAKEVARKEFFPNMTFGLEVIQQDDAREGDPINNGKNPIIASMGVNVPIWWGARSAAEEEAAFKEQEYLQQKRGKANRLSAAMQLALYKYHDAERRVALYRDGLLPKAGQNLEATLAAYQSGRRSALDVIDAERTLLEMRLALVRSVADQNQRLAEVEKLLGREVPVRVEILTLQEEIPPASALPDLQ